MTTGVALYKAAKFSKQHATVMLIGQGSDEIFCGYPNIIHADQQRKVNNFLSKIFSHGGCKLLSEILPMLGNHKVLRKVGSRLDLSGDQLSAAYVASIPKMDFTNIIMGDSISLYYCLLEKYILLLKKYSDRDFLNRILGAEMERGLQIILQNTDRMPMAASVEAREPFLDHELVEFVFSLPPTWKVKGRIGKYIWKKYAEKYFSKDFIYRQKMGFPVPLYSWFKEKKDNSMYESIFENSSFNNPIDNFFKKSYLQVYARKILRERFGFSDDIMLPIIRYYSMGLWFKTINTNTILEY